MKEEKQKKDKKKKKNKGFMLDVVDSGETTELGHKKMLLRITSDVMEQILFLSTEQALIQEKLKVFRGMELGNWLISNVHTIIKDAYGTWYYQNNIPQLVLMSYTKEDRDKIINAGFYNDIDIFAPVPPA